MVHVYIHMYIYYNYEYYCHYVINNNNNNNNIPNLKTIGPSIAVAWLENRRASFASGPSYFADGDDYPL
jgi:hypothetical protein